MSDQTGNTTNTQQPHEDSFFVLRDCRELFLKRLAEIARQSGVSSNAVLDAFTREVGEVHDELATAVQPDGFGMTDGLTASRISLVGNDDLELDIRIGDIANKLKGDERIDHWRVQLRYMTLLNRPKMDVGSNPVGLEPIRSGLWVICRESGLNPDQKLDLLDRLEVQLQLHLPELYSELNNLLESRHVEPAQIQVVQRGKGSGTGGSGGSGGSGGGSGGSIDGSGHGVGFGGLNALSSLQQALQQQFGAEDASSPGFSTGNTGYAAGGAGNVTLNASTLVMLNHLMERLNALELQQPAGPGPDLANGEIIQAAGQTSLRALKSKDLDLPLGKPAAIALDTLSHIFEAIFTAPDLPDVVKAAISRLQIPLLKLAILDASFFADTQHPGRQLVNRMARAAIGLAQDTGRENPICNHLGKLADDVRNSNTLESNAADLSTYLAELDTLIAERDESLQTNAKPYLKLVREHEASELSRSCAQDWLTQALSKTIQPELVSFLSDYWLRVMQAAFAEGGISGARWKECSATIDELVWSVRPKPSLEERKRLASQIPALLKRINAGLDLLNISREERTPFLNTCFDLQTAALRNRSDPAEPAALASVEPLIEPMAFGAPRTTKTMTEPSAFLLENEGKLVQYLGLPSASQPSWRSNANAWKEGDWITFYLPDGERLCGRHCGLLAPSATILLFNTDWGYAVALAPSLLEQQLRDGRARIVSESSLFDDAAERALGKMVPH